MKRVWILGAGFSRPLGGPLLNELLRPEVGQHLQATYGKTFELGDVVLELYGHGSRFRDGEIATRWRTKGELIWSDAEQFLDYLDTAVAGGPNSPAYKRLETLFRHGKNRLEDLGGAVALSAAAKQLIAATCSAFIVGADLSTEKWEPFVKWADNLGASDTIISFNYDCVPELLNSKTHKIQTVGLGQQPYTGRARLLKLHGSVNWRITRDGGAGVLPTGNELVTVEQQKDLDFAVKCDARELAIASPGPIKKAVSAGWLAQLWDQADYALREADGIVFIGYRFPPSDSHARTRLLDAIRANTSRYLAVHTVLGLNSQDTPRLTQLLRFALADRAPAPPRKEPDHQEKQYTLLTHPLFGEDFLSVFPPGWVTQAWHAPY